MEGVVVEKGRSKEKKRKEKEKLLQKSFPQYDLRQNILVF